MANDPIFKPPKGAHDYRRQRLSHHLLSAAPTRHAHASTKMSAMYPNGSVSAVMHGFAPQLSPPRSSSLLQPPVFRARANGALGEQRRAFRGGLYATKAVASATTPTKEVPAS